MSALNAWFWTKIKLRLFFFNERYNRDFYAMGPKLHNSLITYHLLSILVLKIRKIMCMFDMLKSNSLVKIKLCNIFSDLHLIVTFMQWGPNCITCRLLYKVPSCKKIWKIKCKFYMFKSDWLNIKLHFIFFSLAFNRVFYARRSRLHNTLITYPLVRSQKYHM